MLKSIFKHKIIQIIGVALFPCLLTDRGINALSTIFFTNYINYSSGVTLFLTTIFSLGLIAFAIERGIKLILLLTILIVFYCWLLIFTFRLNNTTLDLYAAMALFVFLLGLLLCIGSNSNKKEKKKVIPTKAHPFKEDLPTNTQDSFKRKDLARVIANRIRGSKTETSFGIAVYGEWGSGKTSFLNFIKEETIDLYQVWFSPWGLEEESFLSTLLSEIEGEVDSDIRDSFSALIKLLQSDNSNVYFKSLSFFIEGLFKKRTKESIKEEIRLKLSKKKLVIFLDDLDRLSKKEILQILVLIRNVLNIGNVFFILGIDNKYVKDKLKKIDFENFSEKIFQLKIDLPSVNQHHLSSIIRETFDEILLTQLTTDQLENLYSLSSTKHENNFEINEFTKIFSLIKNKRDANLIYNGFITKYLLLGNNCELGILLLLTILENKNFKLFSYIKFNYYELIDHWEIRKTNSRKNIVHGDNITNVEKFFEDNYSAKKHIDELVAYCNNLDSHLNFFNPRNYKNYFHLSLDEGFVTEKEYNSLYNSDLNGLIAKINEINDKGALSQLLQYFIYPDLNARNRESKIVIIAYIHTWLLMGNHFGGRIDIGGAMRNHSIKFEDIQLLIEEVTIYDECTKAIIYGTMFLNLEFYKKNALIFINRTDTFNDRLISLNNAFPFVVEKDEEDYLSFMELQFNKDPIGYFKCSIYENGDSIYRFRFMAVELINNLQIDLEMFLSDKTEHNTMFEIIDFYNKYIQSNDEDNPFGIKYLFKTFKPFPNEFSFFKNIRINF